MNKTKCEICNNEAITDLFDTSNNKEFIDCSYCGKYSLVDSFKTDIFEDKSNFFKVSSWVREQNELFNIKPNIGREKFSDLLELKDKKIKEKFDLLLFFLKSNKEKIQYQDDYSTTMEHMGGTIDEYINKICKDIIVKCWIQDYTQLSKLFNKAILNEYIKGKTDYSGGCFFEEITFDGIEYLENLENINKDSKSIFAAFNFDDDDIEKIFNIYLKEAIDKEGFNYRVVNQKNVKHNKSINDEIIVKLKSSRIVIADFTNHRNSVYFEAGFAMGMNIPIIWTCQEGDERDMSFDTRQFPHIIWNDKDDLVKQVIDRIKVII